MLKRLWLTPTQRDRLFYNVKKARSLIEKQAFSSCSGDRIRTSDLRVMSPTSYQTAPPRDQFNLTRNQPAGQSLCEEPQDRLNWSLRGVP